MAVQDDSSVALIPSAYGTSKVYSVIPSNGNGDFDFTRSGNATRVNKGGYIENMGSNVPRLDYPLIDGVVQSCPALLLEPQRTNLQIRSEEFSNSAWGKSGSTVTANQVVSPDGSQTADKINDSGSGTGVVQVFDFVSSLSSGSSYTFSVFAKKGTIDYISLRNENFTTPNNSTSYFNISNGTLGTVDTDHTAKIIDYGNGWYRCSITFTISTDTSGNLVIRANEADNTPNVVRNGTKNVYLWGAMFEQGSYQTSYIKTTSGQVTRSADACNGSGTSAEFNDSEGVLFAEFKGFTDTDISNRYITISDGTISNSIGIQLRNSGELRLYNNGVVTANMIYRDAFADLSQNFKIAIKYGTSTSDYKVYINGVSKTVLSGFTATSISGLDVLNLHYASNTLNFYGLVKQVMVFKTALTDSELQTLTS